MTAPAGRPAEQLVATGIDARDIDAGSDWVGAHAAGPRSLVVGDIDATHPYYQGFFPRHRCWISEGRS